MSSDIMPRFSEGRYVINDGRAVIVGQNPTMLDLYHHIDRLASLDTTVLIRGETGTGKELVAKALHFNGSEPRRSKNFVPIECTGIPEGLFEAILFGHVKGSFTGAYVSNRGRIATASGGTLFLDEICDIPLHLQAKLLRLIQEKEYVPVGSNEPMKANVRIVLATNRDLRKEVEGGKFREDLFYRINVCPIELPPLEQRKDDIPLLARYFVDKRNEKRDSNSILHLSSEAEGKLVGRAEWKGNVRELEGIIERAFIMKDKGDILASDISFGDNILDKPVVNHIGPSNTQDGIKSMRAEFSESFKGVEKFFQSGVLPTSICDLIERGCGYNRNVLLDKLHSGSFFRDEEHQKPRIVYLTPSNYRHLFKHKKSKEVVKTGVEISDNAFLNIIGQPFKWYTVRDLSIMPGSYNFNVLKPILKSLADQREIFTVKTASNSQIYAVTPDLVPRIVQNRSGIIGLTEDINRYYEQFCQKLAEFYLGSPAHSAIQTLSPELSSLVWFAKGFWPMSNSGLAALKGTHRRDKLYRIAENPDIHREIITMSSKAAELLYLTPDNAMLFFDDLDSPDYKSLLQKIQNNPLNAIANKPFQLYTKNAMFHESFADQYYYGFMARFDYAVEAGAIVPVETGSFILYALPRDSVGSLVPHKADRESRIKAWQESIEKHWVRTFLK